jgi:hypothetical protein
MASRPMYRRLIALLKKLATEEIGEEATPLDWVCAWIEDGKTVNAMHVYVGERFGEPLSRPWLSGCINKLTPDAKERIAKARQVGTHQLVEDAQEIADATKDEPNREAIASAKLRSDLLLWRAKAYNRAELGEKPASININLNTLHLDAMRVFNSDRRVIPSAVQATIAPDSFEPVTSFEIPAVPRLSA